MKQKLVLKIAVFLVVTNVAFWLSACIHGDPIDQMLTPVTITYSTEWGTPPPLVMVEMDYKLRDEDLPSLSAEHSQFEGWFIGETKITSGYVVKKDITLTAKWTKKPVPEIKKITYDMNGGQFTDKEYPTEYKDGDYISLEEAYRHVSHPDGYYFGGFFSDKECTQYVREVTGHDFPYGVTLYTKWYLSFNSASRLIAITENSIEVEFTIPNIKTQLDSAEIICQNVITREEEIFLIDELTVGAKISHTFTQLDNTKSYKFRLRVYDKNGIEGSTSLPSTSVALACANPGVSVQMESRYIYAIALPDHIYLDKSQLGKKFKISACDQTAYFSRTLFFKSKDKVTWEVCPSEYVVEEGTVYFLAYISGDSDSAFSQICEVTCSDQYDSIGKIYYTDGTYSDSINSSKTIAGIVVDCDKENKPQKIMSLNWQNCVFNDNPVRSYDSYWNIEFNMVDGENNWDVFKTLDDESNFVAYNFVNNINVGNLKWYIPAGAELLTVILNRERIRKGYEKASASLNFPIWASNADDECNGNWCASLTEIRSCDSHYTEVNAYGYAKVK